MWLEKYILSLLLMALTCMVQWAIRFLLQLWLYLYMPYFPSVPLIAHKAQYCSLHLCPPLPMTYGHMGCPIKGNKWLHVIGLDQGILHRIGGCFKLFRHLKIQHGPFFTVWIDVLKNHDKNMDLLPYMHIILDNLYQLYNTDKFIRLLQTVFTKAKYIYFYHCIE